MRGHREPEHTRRGMQRGRARRRAPAAVGVLRSLRVAVDRQPVEKGENGARRPSLVRTRRDAGYPSIFVAIVASSWANDFFARAGGVGDVPPSITYVSIAIAG